ncbi:hypothetical protein ADK67_21935 [Saccharothrix sp. NRRL B-16348]|uniref:hypothetical protein n=1 Tax=Saccharothrix sp. NRRL B-16348 TaxID=1415542 RepID=UPI0006AEF46A|nr:hypothetical protein [Saccharothrix sp. NRRL B-16348]KOX23250.1 hypothetical protein ADK67_21935 [Saccharothrix sp. NRRL B-16348]
MDLIEWFLKRTPPRPFVITSPGGTLARFAVERVIRERGWSTASSPAEANLLVVAGRPTSGLDTYIDRVWHAMPLPRARTHVTAATEAPTALDAAVDRLHDRVRQRDEAAHQPAELPGDAHEMSCGSGMSCGSATPNADHGGHRHEAVHQHDPQEQHREEEPDTDSTHGGHHGHDMSGTEMPGGVPMADRAADRDGLMLDVLHVPLGPALPDWPEGLIVHTVLQGDVVQEAQVELLDGGHHPSWHQEVADPALVHRLDSAARLLSVAGWQDAATTARGLRDDILAGWTPEPQLDRWAKRVRRSRTLRWSLAGIGEHEGADTLDRLYRWIEGEDETLSSDVLPHLLVGTELSAARLIVAGVGLDLGRRVHAHG